MSKEAISEVIHLYASALDSHSWDLFDAIFTPDVDVDYCKVLRWTDLKSWVADFKEMHESTAGHQHFLAPPQVIVDGDKAYALTYGQFHVFRKTPAPDDGDVSMGGAWYDDELVKTPVGWRISRRIARDFWWQHTMPEEGPAKRIVDSFPEWVRSGNSPYMNALRRSLKVKEGVPG
jgi:SnoaL-like domain